MVDRVEKSSPSALPLPVLTESRLSALLTLLADDDPAVRATIRATLMNSGEAVFQRLEVHRFHTQPEIRKRVVELLDDRAREQTDREFIAYSLTHGEQFDLEEGVWCFVLTTHPSVNVRGYMAQLDEWADTLRQRIRPECTAEVSLQALNQYLFGELRFRGSSQDYFNPANSYLNHVMDRRMGSDLTLSLIILLIARRLAMPVTGIGMPGHFLCRYQSSWEELYIDAFLGGKLLTRIDCKRRIANLAVEYDESFLAPLTSRRILHRMISNLFVIYKDLNHRAEMQRLQRYLSVLGRPG